MYFFWRTIVLVQHLVSSLSLGDCSVHTLREDSRNLWSEQSPKESDDTRCCNNTTVLLKMSIIMFETCKKVKQSRYRPGGFQEVKVPRFRDNGTGWWKGCQL